MSEETNDKAPRKIINDTRRHVHAARAEYFDDILKHGTVTAETRKTLIEAAMLYRSTLREHSDHSVIQDKWEESGVDQLAELLQQTRTVEKPSPGDTNNGRTEEVPAVMAVPAEQILKVTERLDEMANELGFGASTTDTTPHDEPDHDDLRGLVKLRGQEDVAERVPGGD